MDSASSSDNDFLAKLTEVIKVNLTNPQFGVSMLARELGMSRSNLHRKVYSSTKISVSQFINQVRLKSAMEMLRHTAFTVSDVAHDVGFSNTSYFIRKFHEYYGYPPGEVGKRLESENETGSSVLFKKKRFIPLILSAVSIIVLAVVLFVVIEPFSFQQNELEKSIAVLFPIYNSNDSTYLHLINGTVDAILNNLSIIGDLTVHPMSSVLKYNNSNKSGTEIAKDLNANYVVESSGIAFENMIRLNIKLIDVTSGTQIWYKPYDVKTDEFIELPQNIARDISHKILVEITPEENRRVEAKPTKNTKAWRLYLKGNEMLAKNDSNNLKQAISYFEQAIQEDSEFALANAMLAQTYFKIIKLTDKSDYTILINEYADKSLFYNNELPQGLIAKAMYYYVLRKYENAIPFLNKALLYNPNSYPALFLLSDIYRLHQPDTEQTLELRLRMNKLSLNGIDSLKKSDFYISLSDAFCEAGFFKEAKFYLDKSLKFNPDNSWAKFNLEISYFNMEINYEKQVRFSLNAINEEIDFDWNAHLLANAYYYLKDDSKALQYYDTIQNKRGLWDHEKLNYSYVLLKLNKQKEAEKYIYEISQRKTTNNSFREHVLLAKFSSLKKDSENAIAHIRMFSKLNNYSYTYIKMLRNDPIFEDLQELNEYKKLMTKIETKFWEDHKRIKATLEEKGLLKQ